MRHIDGGAKNILFSANRTCTRPLNQYEFDNHACTNMIMFARRIGLDHGPIDGNVFTVHYVDEISSKDEIKTN